MLGQHQVLFSKIRPFSTYFQNKCTRRPRALSGEEGMIKRMSLFLVLGCLLYSLSFECFHSLMNFSFIRAKYFCNKMEEKDKLGVCSSYEDFDKDKEELSLMSRRINQHWKRKQGNKHYATNII